MKNKSKLLFVTLMVCAMLFACAATSFAADNGDYTVSVNDTGVTIESYSGGEESVSIPETINGDTVTAIGASAFKDNTQLVSVTIPDTVTSIGASAFSGCTALTSVTVPDTVTSIGISAFEGCFSLESIELPGCDIGAYAFINCSLLSEITFTGDITSLGRYAFSNTAWYIAQDDGAVYIGSALYTYKSQDETDVSITIEDGTTVIAAYAFYNCSEISYVFIPDSVVTIGAYAFADCDELEYLMVPSSVENIGNFAIGYEHQSSGSVITVNEDFFVYCYSDSAALEYCTENGVAYTLVDDCTHDTVYNYEYVSEATCEDSGLMAYVCKKCHYTVSITIPAYGHTWGDWETVSVQDCTTDGVTTRTCETCGKVETVTEAAAGHTWSDWETAVSPSCETEGQSVRYCTVCGESESEAIAATGHTWSEWIVITEPTCVDEGEQQRYCEVCGANETETIEATGEHTWGDWETVVYPTLTEEGLKQHTCSVCGTTEQEVMDVLEPEETLRATDYTLFSIDADEYLVYNVPAGTTVSELLEHFEDSDSILVLDMSSLSALDSDDTVATGNAVFFVVDDTITDFLYISVKGDGTGDGEVSMEDARIALRASLELEAVSTTAKFVALDLNSDGEISITESRNILLVSLSVTTFEKIEAEELAKTEESSSEDASEASSKEEESSD